MCVRARAGKNNIKERDLHESRAAVVTCGPSMKYRSAFSLCVRARARTHACVTHMTSDTDAFGTTNIVRYHILPLFAPCEYVMAAP